MLYTLKALQCFSDQDYIDYQIEQKQSHLTKAITLFLIERNITSEKSKLFIFRFTGKSDKWLFYTCLFDHINSKEFMSLSQWMNLYVQQKW